jgi:hypothetical protein
MHGLVNKALPLPEVLTGLQEALEACQEVQTSWLTEIACWLQWWVLLTCQRMRMNTICHMADT